MPLGNPLLSGHQFEMMQGANLWRSKMNCSKSNRQFVIPVLTGVALALLNPAPAHAGMPTILLTDIARMRIQTISFFLLGLLVSSKLIQWIWNSLSKDFTLLPRLSYFKALGVVTMWGFLFVLVLTMIAGARELMTPGAWEKKGATYRLAEPPQESVPSTDDSTESVRYTK